ncbi:hypothetical protein D7I43_00440 [Micromonospora globbae]|uniref:Uncharacterized protein n=1 Tax=Micromonospora globbae TaxID=1894969 RepID=A0A420F866_9ACTN|nr:hypothetical protein D7I43_00440 [Micromonospora globbae]
MDGSGAGTGYLLCRPASSRIVADQGPRRPGLPHYRTLTAPTWTIMRLAGTDRTERPANLMIDGARRGEAGRGAGGAEAVANSLREAPYRLGGRPRRLR